MRLVCLVLLCGCSRAQPDASAPVAPLAAAAAPEEIVATVDGRPITAAQVATQARARGVDARTALSDLVDAEALAGEAARRRLDRSLDARLAAKGAMVRQLLHDSFEHDVTPADVPPDLVRKAYNRNQPYLNHDIYADVWHVLVRLPKDATAEQRQAAHAIAEDVARRGRGGTVENFRLVGQSVQSTSTLTIDNPQELMTERDGWTQKSFSYAAFTLKKPGDTVVAESSFGVHAIYLVRYLPAVHKTLAEVDGKLRQELFESDVQKKAFAHFLDEAMARHHIEAHPERLPRETGTP